MMVRSKMPAGLGASGKSLWSSVLDEYELDRHEELVLLQACRCVDRLDELATEAASGPVTVENKRGDLVPHPAITESRQQSLTLARLLASLRLPAGEEAGRPQRRGGARGSYGVRGIA